MPKATSGFLLKWNKLLLLEEIVSQIDELKKAKMNKHNNTHDMYEIMNIVNNQLHLVAFELVLCTLQWCSA